MKKLLTLTALLGVASLSYGQGYVAMYSTTLSNTRPSTNGVTSGKAGGTVGEGFDYELLFAPVGTAAPTTVSALSAWTPTTTTATGFNSSATTAGAFTGSTAPDGVGIQVPGSTAGNSYAFVIVGWSANLGPNYANVIAGAPANLVSGVATYGSGATWTTLATAGADPVVSPNGAPGGWFGISGVAGNIPTVAINGSYANVMGSATGGLIPGFAMNYYAVPEPASMALAGLGAAAMLIFRRRK